VLGEISRRLGRESNTRRLWVNGCVKTEMGPRGLPSKKVSGLGLGFGLYALVSSLDVTGLKLRNYVCLGILWFINYDLKEIWLTFDAQYKTVILILLT